MADSALNRLEGPGSTVRPGDVPDRVKRRYLRDATGGPGVGFYVDATAMAPAFRDQGRRLTTDRNDPQVVRDLVAIARHRGWTTLAVRGHSDFRREVWIAARTAGLEVRGYPPTARDLQDLARRLERQARRPGRGPAEPPAPASPGATDRLRTVETVVRSRIAEPAEQDRVIARARERIAGWLQRGARFEGPPRERPRDRTRG
jgi:hypothetical protein